MDAFNQNKDPNDTLAASGQSFSDYYLLSSETRFSRSALPALPAPVGCLHAGLHDGHMEVTSGLKLVPWLCAGSFITINNAANKRTILAGAPITKGGLSTAKVPSHSSRSLPVHIACCTVSMFLWLCICPNSTGRNCCSGLRWRHRGAPMSSC